MKRILVVDDDANIRSVIVEALSESGYNVLVAENGQDALAVARTQHPHLILMDLMLPKLDGVVATCLLKSDPATQWIRIVAMSAGVNLRFFSENLPADGLLSKPFDLDTLLADITVHLRQVVPPQQYDVV